MSSHFYGEEQCSVNKLSGEQCTNKAYFLCDKKHLTCGIHKKKFESAGKKVVELSKNPNAKKEKEDAMKSHEASIKKAKKENVAENRKGDIMLSKLQMRKAVEYTPGYLKIFPNFRHANRKDGKGIPELSPITLGPVLHGQPGLPKCKNLENFHQGNKVFTEELAPGGKKPNKKFFEHQLAMYRDAVPWRHKYDKFSDIDRSSDFSIFCFIC